MASPILAGAEPWSVSAGPEGGALCLHGFGGTPSAMRAMGEAFLEAGFAVEVPLLPGHGTAVEELALTGWDDWTRAAEAALARLQGDGRRVVVVGQSMGAALALWLATRHPVAGLVCINTVVIPQPPEAIEMIDEMLAAGETVVPAGRPDIADPAAVEVAYRATPLRPLRELQDALAALLPRLGEVRVPMLVAVSPEDHVVDPAGSDILAAAVSGTVERLVLARSYHVATLDYDAPLLRSRAVAFALEACSRAGAAGGGG